MASLWVVSGAPGAGKTTVAHELTALLDPIPACLDKDTMYGPIDASMLRSHGRPESEQEGDWYNTNVKPYEYKGMFDTAKEIRLLGCPVLLCAPFTSYVRDDAKWSELVDECGGGDARLIWVRSDAPTVRQRMTARGLERNADQLAEFDAFIDRVRPDVSPVVPYLEIDNRLEARLLSIQLRTLIGVPGFSEATQLDESSRRVDL